MTSGPDWVRVIGIENNEFYRLIGREPSRVNLTYYFDEQKKITGVLVAGVPKPEKARDLFEEAKAWLRERYPDELDFLMPGGKLDPSLDRAKLWKNLLNQWRKETGKPPNPHSPR